MPRKVRPVPSWICSASGPTPVRNGRRFMPTSTTSASQAARDRAARVLPAQARPARAPYTAIALTPTSSLVSASGGGTSGRRSFW